jgi:hypothetical protein
MCFNPVEIAQSYRRETPTMLTTEELEQARSTFHIEVPRTPEEQKEFLKRLRNIGQPRRQRNQ